MAVEDGASLRRPGRTWVAAGVSAAIVALAVTAGLRSSPMSLGPLIAVDSVSARVSGALLALGTAAPLGYALLLITSATDAMRPASARSPAARWQ